MHNKCKPSKNPNGYSVGDIDEHGRLSPNANRAPGNLNVANNNRVQSHHIIQDKWAENIPGYVRDDAPAILLETGQGKPHTNITNSQMSRRRKDGGYTTTIVEEFNYSYRELLQAGISPKKAKKAIGRAYKYFESIGAFKGVFD